MSDPCGDPYPEFFEAIVFLAYPDDAKRLREAHSAWSGPRDYPPVVSELGWTPEIGKGAKTMWLKCGSGEIPAQFRRGPLDWTMLEPFQPIDPGEFRRRLEEAERRARLPSRRRIPIPEGYLLDGEPPLGDRVDPRLPERDVFLACLAYLTFLQSVVVSRDALMILRSACAVPEGEATPEAAEVASEAAPASFGAAISLSEAGRRGGVANQEARREDLTPWRSILLRVAQKKREADPSVLGKTIVAETTRECDREGVAHPKPRQMTAVLSDLVTTGQVPAKQKAQ